MANFTLENRLKTLDDPIRTWNFEFIIPNFSEVTNEFDDVINDDDDLTVRIRTAGLPSRGNDPIESNFLGMKQWFPGKPTFTHTLALQVEDTEDQIMHRALTAWQDLLFNTDPTATDAGGASRLLKREMTRNAFLIPYKYNKTSTPKKVRFFNSFIQEVGEVSLDYNSNGLVTFPVTLQFDFWRLVD